MSRGRRGRRDEPDATGFDSRESRRSRRSGGPDDEWQPSSRAVVDGWPSGRGDYGGGGSYADQGGYPASDGYQGPDDRYSGSYPEQGGYAGTDGSSPGGTYGYQNGTYADNGYGGGAHGGPARPDDPYASGGYGSYRSDDYNDPGYGRGQHSDSGYPGGHSSGFAQPDPYAGLTDPLGRTDPGRHTDPHGTSGPYSGALEPYRGGAGNSGAGYSGSGHESAGYDRTGYDRPGYDDGGHDQRGYGALEPYGGGAGYGGANYNGAGYQDAGYNGAGYDRAGYAGADYEGDSGGWAGQGERGYRSADAYDDAGGYGNRGSYNGEGQYGTAAYGSGGPYEGHDATGPGVGRGGQAPGYAYGGGYDEQGYEPGWETGQQDQYPAGERGYDPGSYPGEQNYPGDPDPLADSGLGSAVGRGSRNDWQAPLDDIGMRRRRNRAEDEIDADDARHNNFFRGFGRGDDDYTHRPPKKRRRSRAGMVALCVLVLFLAGIVGGGVYGYKWYEKRHADFSGPVGGPVMVQVKPGAFACSATLENSLVNLGVVASATAFCDAAKSAGNSAALEPGFFRLHKHMSGKAAWALLVSPKSRVQTNLAVPDGLRYSKIIALLAAKTGIPVSQFQSALKNDVSQLGLPSWAKGNPEGFLYPATYPVQPGTSALDILKTMVAKFNSETASQNLVARAKADHFNNVYEVIIEASLLEGEVGPQYYRQVARVIDNRLNQRWYLGFNSTVAYALNKYTFNFTESQLHNSSPYNTMNHYGLPPGPIDSPDLAAIEAVLHPAPDNGNMYFITINKAGKTLFTSSQSQFNAWSQLAIRNGV